jgi:hypothetical protein
VGRRIWQGEEPKRPKWAGPKNKFAKNEKFQAPKMTVKITTFTTHLTTHLPSKNHVLRTVFCKTPCKNEVLPRIKKVRSNNSSKG